MSQTGKDLREKWLQILNTKLDELIDILNKCGEYQTIILRSHLFAEQILEGIIEQELPKPDFVLEKSRLNFEQKLHLVHGLNQFEKDIYDSIKFLNNIRNKYAHNLDYEISKEEIFSLGRSLGKNQFKELKDFADSDMHLLVLIVHNICKKALIIYSLNEGAARALEENE